MKGRRHGPPSRPVTFPSPVTDIATFPRLRNLIGFYEAGDLVGIDDFPHVTRALTPFLARPG